MKFRIGKCCFSLSNRTTFFRKKVAKKHSQNNNLLKNLIYFILQKVSISFEIKFYRRSILIETVQ
jgi:hypothetical protein